MAFILTLLVDWNLRYNYYICFSNTIHSLTRTTFRDVCCFRLLVIIIINMFTHIITMQYCCVCLYGYHPLWWNWGQFAFFLLLLFMYLLAIWKHTSSILFMNPKWIILQGRLCVLIFDAECIINTIGYNYLF